MCSGQKILSFVLQAALSAWAFLGTCSEGFCSEIPPSFDPCSGAVQGLGQGAGAEEDIGFLSEMRARYDISPDDLVEIQASRGGANVPPSAEWLKRLYESDALSMLKIKAAVFGMRFQTLGERSGAVHEPSDHLETLRELRELRELRVAIEAENAAWEEELREGRAARVESLFRFVLRAQELGLDLIALDLLNDAIEFSSDAEQVFEWRKMAASLALKLARQVEEAGLASWVLDLAAASFLSEVGSLAKANEILRRLGLIQDSHPDFSPEDWNALCKHLVALGLEPKEFLDKSRDQILEAVKKRHRNLAPALHPDRNPNSGPEAFVAMQAAYEAAKDLLECVVP